MWLVNGDLDYKHKVLHLECPTGTNPCTKCKCNTTTVPWTGVHPTESVWFDHPWTDADWYDAHPEAPQLFDPEQGIGIDNLSDDWMHCKHLGTDQYLYGSVLMMLTHNTDGRSMMEHNPGQNMTQLWTLWRIIILSLACEGGKFDGKGAFAIIFPPSPFFVNAYGYKKNYGKKYVTLAPLITSLGDSV